jgi:hypothetical protein
MSKRVPLDTVSGFCKRYQALPNPEVVDALERRATSAANDGVTIRAYERVGNGLRTSGAIEFDVGLWSV